jgi:hypothetical protein
VVACRCADRDGHGCHSNNGHRGCHCGVVGVWGMMALPRLP